jgi:hypothetical protein
MGFLRPAGRRHAFGFVGVLAVVSALAVLAFAGIGQAASKHVCTTSSVGEPGQTGFTPASCVTETLVPHTLTVSGTTIYSGLSLTKFTNQGSSNASHGSLQVTFSANVLVSDVKLMVGGAALSSSLCSPTSGLTTTVLCSDIGNVPSNSTARLIVTYSRSVIGAVTAYGTAGYAEAGNDNSGGPNGTTNDFQDSALDTVQVVAAGSGGNPLQAGQCTTTGSTVIGSDATLSAQASYPATSVTFLPCTPVSAGVIQQTPTGFHTEIAFAELPQLSSPGYAVVTIQIASLWTQLKRVVLYEDTSAAGQPFFTTKITIPACGTDGLPPKPGVVPVGATDPSPKNDTCISDRSPASGGGGTFFLHVLGTGIDPKIGG